MHVDSMAAETIAWQCRFLRMPSMKVFTEKPTRRIGVARPRRSQLPALFLTSCCLRYNNHGVRRAGYASSL